MGSQIGMMTLSDKSLFHVHTFRCGHAENVSDEVYIKKAVEIGATDIWFTDHAPFPGNPFGNRMAINQLPEYLSTLSTLKTRYSAQIKVHIGLETEYFPSFDESGYYRYLADNTEIELLLLGQHMAETSDVFHTYTFSWDEERLKAEEFIALGEATIEGINTGYFGAVAHPDRIFRRCESWTKPMGEISKRIIDAAVKKNIPLEQNQESMHHKGYLRPEFWNIAKLRGANIIQGLDAHSPQALKVIGKLAP